MIYIPKLNSYDHVSFERIRFGNLSKDCRILKSIRTLFHLIKSKKVSKMEQYRCLQLPDWPSFKPQNWVFLFLKWSASHNSDH